MKYNYRKIINCLKTKYDLYQEDKKDDYIYFLNMEFRNRSESDGSFLLQEIPEGIIIWSNEIKELSYKEMYSRFIELVNCDIFFPFVETTEEAKTIEVLGGEKFDFEKELPSIEVCEDYSREIGSFVIRRKTR